MVSEGEFLVLDDLMAEGGEDKELLDLFTKHSHHQNITVSTCFMFPKRILRNAYYIRAFKNPRDQLGHEEFTASSLSHLLARYDRCVSKTDRTTGPGFSSPQ